MDNSKPIVLYPESKTLVSPSRAYHLILNPDSVTVCENTSLNCETSLSLETSSMSPFAPCNYSLICPTMSGRACADQGLTLEGAQGMTHVCNEGHLYSFPMSPGGEATNIKFWYSELTSPFFLSCYFWCPNGQVQNQGGNTIALMFWWFLYLFLKFVI